MKPYPKHKPSGIQWLGDIPSHWEVKSFKRIWKKENRPVRDEDDVVTAFRDGMVTLRKNRREDGFTFAVQEFGYQGIRKNDLVIHGMDAFAGAIGVSDSDGKSSPVYQVCTPRDEANPYYYALLFREMSRNGYILSLARGIRERSTDFKYNEFGKLPLPLPPITEQHAIAAFLDRKTKEIDSFLETKKNLIAVLKEQKAAIINDAVTGKYNSALRQAQGDNKLPQNDKNKNVIMNKNVMVSLSNPCLNDVAPIRQAQGDKSPLGDIPSHWEVKKMRYILLDGSKGIRIGPFGSSLNAQFIKSSGYKVYGQENVIKEDFSMGNRFIDDAKFKELKVNQIFPGDLIVTMMGTVGKAQIVPDNIQEGIMDSHLIRLRTKQKIVYSAFLEYLINKSYYIKVNIKTLSKGSIMEGLNSSIIKSLFIALPPLHEQHTIVAHIEKEMERIDYIIQQTEKEMELMKEYKQALISEAVTGKIRVE